MTQDQTKQTANLVVRRFSGPAADEIHVRCRPAGCLRDDISRQAESVYQALASLLSSQGESLAPVIHEVVFFRNIRRDFEQFRNARQRLFGTAGGVRPLLPATTFIEQPPLDTPSDFVLNAIAVIPREGSMKHGIASPGGGRSFRLGEQRHYYAGSIVGTPGSAFDETHSMFCRAEDLLKQEGMSFHDVMRTWIYLRRMDRDYAEFNRGRREFFRERNITLLPASTGISGAPFPESANFLLSFFAIQSPRKLEPEPMTTPTLNEACTYGSDFSRGLRVVEENKVALYISGTASVDEEGRTAHVDQFEAQVERMLLNVETLLSAQHASFQDLLSAVTYLKNPQDAPVLYKVLRAKGLDQIPNAVVHAAVCRPDLLCEFEAIAALPLP